MLCGLEYAGATSGDGGGKLPSGHKQRIVPGNNLAGDANRFAHGEAEGVGGHRIHVAGDFVGEAAVILEASCDVGDVEFRFDDGLAGVAAFQFGELRGVLADFFGKSEENAAAILRRGSGPGAGIKCGAGGLDGFVGVFGVRGGDLGYYFFGGGIVDGERFAGGATDPLAVDVVQISPNAGFGDAGHDLTPFRLHFTTQRPRKQACARICACRK